MDNENTLPALGGQHEMPPMRDPHEVEQERAEMRLACLAAYQEVKRVIEQQKAALPDDEMASPVRGDFEFLIARIEHSLTRF